jgi:hypothetical protein
MRCKLYATVNKQCSRLPSKLTQAVMLPTCIRLVPGSILERVTDSLVMCAFPQYLQANAEIVPQIRQLPRLSLCFPVNYYRIILTFDAK